MSESLKVILKPTVLFAGKLDEAGYELQLALLTKPARPEGIDFDELDVPGYARQFVLFEGRPGSQLKGRNDVTFVFSARVSADICQVAAFDSENRLVAYCRPTPTSNVRKSVETISIKADALFMDRVL